MEKGRIAFVVQRYGLNINGGAEYHCRVLAEHMTKDYQVDVLTSCADNYTPWDNYIVYLGRVSGGKNYAELNRFFMEYKLRNPSTLKLVVVGKVDDGMRIFNSKDIIYTGFVTEEEKKAIIQNAKLLVMPSRFESLSLVILESMAARRPVLVNGRCEVLKGQCIRSNAGLYYTDFFEFEAALNYILNNPESYQQMCENGYQFVKNTYDWDKIVESVGSLIEEIGA